MIPLCEHTVIAGKYRLLRELAAGGMGAVWVAHHLALDEDVAIKFMSAALPEPADARARFAREARAAARLRGPHVVQILDHGIDDDVPYLVMELLEGEHLGERLRREGRLSLRATAIIAEQVARALARAHRAGIVHRDLKPANIFLAHVDDEEVVKLLDFGIAKLMDRALADVTSTDVLMGSPQYMSPEQARGARDVDHRADLWSLGAILFRAITGTPAFEGSTAVDVIVRICAGPPPLASRVLPGLPPELDAFFRRALDREPSRRFDSAREMADVFAALVGHRDSAVDLGSAPRLDAHARENTPTQITARVSRPPGAPRPESTLPPPRAEEEDIEAFVDRAFDAMVALDPPLGDLAIREPVASGSVSLPRAPLDSSEIRAPETTVPVLRRPGTRGWRHASSAAPAIAVDFRARPDSEAPSGARWLVAPAPAGSLHAVAMLIDEGFTALRRGETDTARRAWQEALDLEPTNRMLALNLRHLDAIGRRGRE